MTKRKIVVDDVEYIYVIGSDNLRITKPDGKSYAVGLDVVTGLDWQEIERAKRKWYFSVTPREVEATIRKTT